MYVRNVAGYNFAFKYRGNVMYIPADGKIYSIPDDSGTYRELKVVPAMHIRTQSVTYLNKDGSTASDKLSGHKRRGRPPKVVDPDKPLKGVKVKRPIKPIVETPIEKDIAPVEDDNSIMDIDLDSELSDVQTKEVPNVDEEVITPGVVLDANTNVEEKVEDKPSTTKKSTSGKKRGRPRKKKSQ